jgi:glycosyltransferase involved in cell wall biosynthesis
LLKKEIRKSGVEHRVNFLGYRTDVNEIMSKAAALVVPSLSEGFGFITAEAMFNGCLVIGNNTAGTKEQFENWDNIGLPYSGHQDLVDTLKTVVDNGIEFYFQMILRGQAISSSLYSQEQSSKSVYHLYNSII